MPPLQRLWAATSGYKTHLAGLLAAVLIANQSGHWIPVEYVNYLTAAVAALGVSGVAHKLDQQKHALLETSQALAAWAEVFPLPVLNALGAALAGISGPPQTAGAAPVIRQVFVPGPAPVEAGLGFGPASGVLGQMVTRLLAPKQDRAAEITAEMTEGVGTVTPKHANISLDLSLLLPLLLPGADVPAMLASAGEAGVRKLLAETLAHRWLDAAVKIATAQENDGKGLAQVDRVTAIREAQFRLWKVIVKNGHIADAFRDRHHEKIVAALTASQETVTSTLDLVRLVAKAELELTL